MSSLPPAQNPMQLMGLPQTTHRQPSFSSPSCCRRETVQPRLSELLTSGCSQLRVPCPQHRTACTSNTVHQRRPSSGRAATLLRHWQFTITKRSSAGQQIFFLLRQQARQPQLRKVGPPGLETPYLAGVTLKGTALPPPAPACLLARLPAAHIPHPTLGPGLACPAWCVAQAWYAPAPAPAPANTAGPCSSVFIYLLHPPLPARLCLTSDSFSLILSLSTFLTIPQ